MKTDRMLIQRTCQGGFSLIELMIAVVVFAFVIAASFATYINFIHSTTRETALTAINADAVTSLKLLENDIRMAGFGLPQATRVASDDNCNVGAESFCKANTDRIFVADGWEILRDFTDNQAEDGQIPVPPGSIDYYSKISDAKYNNTYKANLISDAALGATFTTVNKLDIDIDDEYHDPSEDIKANKAFIISDGANVEGHRIYRIPSTSITFLSHESLNHSYAANSSVVPAIAWYVREDPDGRTYPDGSKIYWLYRNQNRVIPYVDNFQIRYGYDAEPNSPTTGGIQSADWADVIPPPSNPDGESFKFSHLKAVRITLKIKFIDKKDPTKAIITDFSKTVDLKN